MKALRDYLERTQTTQDAFAREMGVTQATVANWVRGVHSASAATLKRIGQKTGLTVDELLADDMTISSNSKASGAHVR